MLISEAPLQVLPTLAVAIGLSEALFLQQLHYWVQRSRHAWDGRCWVYNDYEAWRKQFPFWSCRTLRRIINRLEKPLPGCSGALILSTTHLNRHPMEQTKWYTIDYDVLEARCAKMDNDVDDMSEGALLDEELDVSPGAETASPCGQDDPMSYPDWTDAGGQSGQSMWPSWPHGTGQVGCLFLNRLPESTNPSACAPARETKAGEGHMDASDNRSGEPTFQGDVSTQALILVQRFHSQVHQAAGITPRPKEFEHAISLIERYGLAFAAYFVSFACKAVRQEQFSPQFFGGLMRHEASALATYRHEQNRKAKRRAEAAQAQAVYKEVQYEQHRAARIAAYRDTLAAEDVDALRQEVRARLEAEYSGVPRTVLGVSVNAEFQERLADQAGVPSFGDWCARQTSEREDNTCEAE